MCNMKRIGLSASAEMPFENVDGPRMTDGRQTDNENFFIL